MNIKYLTVRVGFWASLGIESTTTNQGSIIWTRFTYRPHCRIFLIGLFFDGAVEEHIRRTLTTLKILIFSSGGKPIKPRDGFPQVGREIRSQFQISRDAGVFL